MPKQSVCLYKLIMSKPLCISVFFPLSSKVITIEKKQYVYCMKSNGLLTGSSMAHEARKKGKLELNWKKRKKEILGKAEVVF